MFPWLLAASCQEKAERKADAAPRNALNARECTMLFNQVKAQTRWHQPSNAYGQVPRRTAWMTKPGCSCRYRYGGVEVESQPFPPFMNELLEKVMWHCGLDSWPDSCNLNFYPDAGASVGWHADDEALFQGKLQDIRALERSRVTCFSSFLLAF